MDREFFGRPDIDLPEEESVQKVIGPEQIKEAQQILLQYKTGKQHFENRVVDDELWWELRHWESIRKTKNRLAADPASAWLFNVILNKHADAMDNSPEPIVLPRERSDEESAKTLSAVLPVVMEYNSFDRTYWSNWWDKLKHGTCAYSVTWNSRKDNGLGDIDIQPIDLLNLFWQPGITDIQHSRNLFITDMVDEDVLEAEYPELKGKFKGDAINVKEYLYDETIDTTNKVVVVDWYYKVTNGDRTVVHYCRFCGNEVLYASENDPELRDRGFYDHGMYPVVLDILFPEKGTPIGFGYIAICKDPQLYIDKLSGNILENAVMGTKKRFFVSNSTGVNEEEFADWTKSIVHVEGELTDARIREIEISPPSPIYTNILQMKIEEMKDTSSNRDVNTGSAGAGVTAAAAIAALQEAGNKTSRDMISASYRAYTDIVKMVIELMRQFYDFSRSFRITGEMPGEFEYVDISNVGLRDQPTGINEFGETLYRRPIFDLKVKAQKKNPFSRMEENERAKELYAMGFFNPERAQEALGALEMMDFEGIDKVREQVNQGQTLLNMVQQLQMQLQQMQGMMAQITGVPPMGVPGSPVQAAPPAADSKAVDEDGVAGGVMEAQTPMTSYGERLAKRSRPDMNVSGKDLTK